MATACNTAAGAGDSAADSGKRIPYLPRSTVAVGATWAGANRLYLSGRVVYRSVRFEDKENLTDRVPLERGMVLHIPEMEWHAFRCGPDGFVDIIFIYGQADNIRPEEKR